MTTNQPPTWHDPKEKPTVFAVDTDIYVMHNDKSIARIPSNVYRVNDFAPTIIGWLYDYELIPKLPTVEEAAIAFVEHFIEVYHLNIPDGINKTLQAYIQAKERSGK